MSLATAPGQTLRPASSWPIQRQQRSGTPPVFLAATTTTRLLRSTAGSAPPLAPLSSIARRTTSGSCVTAAKLAVVARGVGSHYCLTSWRRRGEGAKELYSVCCYARSTFNSSGRLGVRRAPVSGVVHGSGALVRLSITTRCQTRGGGRGSQAAGGGRGSRGGGRGGGGRGGRNNSRGPWVDNSLLTNATSVQEILSNVKEKLGELDVVNMSTAFSRIGRMATRRDLSPRHLTSDEAFQELLRRARDFARNGKFPARELANKLQSVAKLCAARRVDVADGAVKATVEALETAAVRVASRMNPQEFANTLWAYATLKNGCAGSAMLCGELTATSQRWR